MSYSKLLLNDIFESIPELDISKLAALSGTSRTALSAIVNERNKELAFSSIVKILCALENNYDVYAEHFISRMVSACLDTDHLTDSDLY